MQFVYGTTYLLFEAYPIVFAQGHGQNAGVLGLMYIPVFLGGACATVAYVWIFNPRYERLVARYAPHAVPPEFRLEPAQWAAPLFAGSFFWFGWTSYPSISFWAPMMSGLALGCGTVAIFVALYNYVVDAHLEVAASALAANTVARSAFGAGFPLFAAQMYERLGPPGASSLLGGLAVLFAPIPFVLARYGPALRARSTYARPQTRVGGAKGREEEQAVNAP